ncbi:MAG: exo-beta-N-acetylmuramidase NamZ domain-containing protein [Bacteroidales bacterium]
MYKNMTVALILMMCISCQGDVDIPSVETNDTISAEQDKPIVCGAERTDEYVSVLEGKSVGIVANHTSMINDVHLVDSLLSMGIVVKRIFAPEHGFRGMADAGEMIENETDATTGLPVISLYGNNKKPEKTHLSDLDVMVFDIQDVGVRFYTYISTLHYVMEACAGVNLPLMVLDRPNPNTDVIDGPVLNPEYASFVGMHPVPIAHGMTVAEYARMINGEGWLKDGMSCDLSWVCCDNYNHRMQYKVPVPPSPNLPNHRSIRLYPTLCLLEATTLSVGRGTDMQFQVCGHPALKEKTEFSFVPQPNEGATYPKHENTTCYGFDLRENSDGFQFNPGQLQLAFLLDLYEIFPNDVSFFKSPSFFDKLSGDSRLRHQITKGHSEDSIRQSWQADLTSYKKMRQRYLLYE